jgi:GntR family transcriptional regulator
MLSRRDAIGKALRQRVTSGLHLGLLHPGERLASARETARQLGTDYRVVVEAVRQLARDGLLEIRPRAGIFVGRGVGRPLSGNMAGLGARLVDLLVEEVMRGLPAPGLVERVRRCLESVRLRAACIECNRDQLDALCHELSVDYGFASTPVDMAELRRLAPTLRQADLLVSTSFHAGEVRHLARRMAKRCVIVTLDPAWRAEVERLLEAGPVYFIGTDPRWAAKALQVWATAAGVANLRPLTIGQHRLEDIPADAAVMVMPGARRHLAGTPLLARALPQRGFSRETAHEILRFVVERNLAAQPAPG